MARLRSSIGWAGERKFGILLLALIALMATAPIVFESGSGNVALSLFVDGVLVASLHAARPGRRPVVIGLVLALADFAIGQLVALGAFGGARWLLLLESALWLLILSFVTTMILAAIFGTRNVTVETLLASLCVYMLQGLLWVFLYTLIQLAAAQSFQSQAGPPLDWSSGNSRRVAFMRMLVFSYSTLTGSGYADVVPATGFARMAGSLEAMVAQVYLAVIIARLVGLHASAALTEHRSE